MIYTRICTMSTRVCVKGNNYTQEKTTLIRFADKTCTYEFIITIQHVVF